MAKKKIGKTLTGGNMEVKYTADDEPIKDNEHSLAFKEELNRWQASPRKYWWEHGGKKKVLMGFVIGLLIAVFSVVLLGV